jgi:hypothetical protein
MNEVLHFRISRHCTATIYLNGQPTTEAIHKLARIMHFLGNLEVYPPQIDSVDCSPNSSVRRETADNIEGSDRP